MIFLDCNLTYGPDTMKRAFGLGPGDTPAGTGADATAKPVGADVFRRIPPGCASAGELSAQLERAGIAGGLVYYAMQEPIQGNAALAEDLARLSGDSRLSGSPRLSGVWSLLPSCTGEIAPPGELPALMKKHNIAALTLSPGIHRYLPKAPVIGDYLEMAVERKIPVMLNTGRGLSIEDAYDLLRAFRELTAILTYDNGWPNDRMLRPFLEAFPNVYLDASNIFIASWLPDIVNRYSARRVMFGSGFPASYAGAHMMIIKHAAISDADKALIAGGNLKNVMEEARYD